MKIDLVVAERTDGFAVLLDVGDHEDVTFGHRPRRVAARVLGGRPEIPGEAHLVGFAQGVVSKQKYTMIDEGLAHGGDCYGGPWDRSSPPTSAARAPPLGRTWKLSLTFSLHVRESLERALGLSGR